MLFIGIDISKSSFNVAVLDDKTYSNSQFENNQTGFDALIKWVNQFKSDSIFCLEATGIYSLGLAKYLHRKKRTVVLVKRRAFRAAYQQASP